MKLASRDLKSNPKVHVKSEHMYLRLIPHLCMSLIFFKRVCHLTYLSTKKKIPVAVTEDKGKMDKSDVQRFIFKACNT